MTAGKYEYDHDTEKRMRSFVGFYKHILLQPLVLNVDNKPVTCRSERKNVLARTKAMTDYLFLQHGENFIWGRTVFSEIVASRLLVGSIRRNGFAVIQATTDIDASVDNSKGSYQKGADIVICDRQQGIAGDKLTPICGIDVTIGSELTVADKTAKFGWQTRLNMSVLVWPLTDLVYGGDLSFIDYLDRWGRESVLCFGRYRSFHQLPDETVAVWRHTISSGLLQAAATCQLNLESGSGQRMALSEDRVRERLQSTENIFRGISQR